MAVTSTIATGASAVGATEPTAATATTTAPTTATTTATVPTLDWVDCGETEEAVAAGVQCASAELPLDYDEPSGEQVSIAVAKVPAADEANRIGSLFYNFGGPGGPAVEYLQAAGPGLFAALNERFDIVAFDPRGVGQSVPSVNCQVDLLSGEFFPRPAPTPFDVNPEELVAGAQAYVDACVATNDPDALAHLSTANVARDLDQLRQAVGDEKLSYIGFSYGTFLGATYAALFPDGYRALVLDGPVDIARYISDPVGLATAQAASFERALDRFAAACGQDQEACSGFGGADPLAAYDALLARAAADPLPADRYTADPTPVIADDIRDITTTLLYAKRLWGLLALALAEAEAGDGSLVRAIIDQIVYPEGDPSTDRFFAIQGSERQWPTDVDSYIERGEDEWAAIRHFWPNYAYSEIPLALWPVEDEDVYAGPFDIDPAAPAPLVIGTTYDPATPYYAALRSVEDLGNARLITMDGDGHTAYGGKSTCIDGATQAYLFDLALPEAGTVCEEETPFVAPAPSPAEASAAVRTALPHIAHIR
ncbi:alpha/beta hydrolase [Geodermatophilus sp. YIM 151500]|uniref:alpha/beta hydrolase n=1 Tax=Geodermatophilus sp. YIM 151500 TaxID=2984531 RepID=UPI0021E4F93C|nr:alpha/beta hydrolase [Geodermatophilus sp. YIM 151500]MCV2487789.1 alpha/beta hydrolase [Geodermatophilus sp. YIM 151500]